MIETVSISDHNYIMPTVVMICSVCENNKEIPITFHMIVDDSVDDTDKESFYTLLNNYTQKEVVFHPVNLEHLSSIPKSNMFPLSTYYRMELAEILPQSINKVLFLDGDMIVRHSIVDVWNTDLKDYAYAAVHDNTEGTISYYNRLGYESKYGYFNSGVMLINLDYWRDNKITIQMMDFISKYPERILYCDQDVFNYILHGKILPLHIKYNLQNGFLLAPEIMKCDYYEYKEEIEDAIENPVIVHYTASTQKPWFKGCKHPMTDEFLMYRGKTPFANIPLYKKKNFSFSIIIGAVRTMISFLREPDYVTNKK